MANDNVEVEIKIKLTKTRFDKIEKQISKIAKKIKTSHHIDAYYNPVDKSFLKPKYPYKWLAVRQRDGKVTLNFKHWYPEGVKNTTHCHEYETEVANKEQIENILKALNFENFVTVDKKRTIYNKNEFEIALDEVKNLGYFIEVESIKNKGGVKKSYQKILDFLKVLGIKETTTVPGGYAAGLMRNLKQKRTAW